MVDIDKVLILIGMVTVALVMVMFFTAYVTRRSFTDEPLFPKPEVIEVIKEETQEERYSREAEEFNDLKGQL